jgi:hypothetical protein
MSNVEKDTDASETIYTAKTDDNTVSYTLPAISVAIIVTL